MQSWDNQSRNQGRTFSRRGQNTPEGGGSRTSYDSPSYGQSYHRTDEDDFSSYDREGRYDRGERSQYAGSQAQYDRQNTSGWGQDSSPNDESDYRSSYQGFSDRDRSQDRYGYGRDLENNRGSGYQTGYRDQGRDYRTEQDRKRFDYESPNGRHYRQDYGSAGRYSQSEYGRGSSMDNTSVRDYDIARNSERDYGYNTRRSPETGFSSSSRSWEGDTEKAPYNYGSSRRDWSGHGGSAHYGPYTGRGPRGFKRSDDRIKEDINEMLTRHPEIDASDIEIEVKEGDVTLNGVVPERSMKHLTEDIVERCLGVHDITNQLRVKRESESGESAYGTSSSSSSKTGGGSLSSGSAAKKSSTSSTTGNH